MSDELILLHVFSAFLSVSLKMVTWHVGGPDFALSAPWLFKFLWLWLVSSNLLGLLFLNNGNLNLILLDDLNGFLAELGSMGNSSLGISFLLGI